MTKIILLFLTIAAVIHGGSSSNVNRTEDGVIKFVEPPADESEAMIEKIRNDIENHKRFKEMMNIKNKLTSSTEKTSSIETSSATTGALIEASTSKSTDSQASEPQNSTEEPKATTPEAQPSSSTVRKVVLDFGESDVTNETPEDDEDVIETTDGSILGDRFILNAPVICKAPRVPDKDGKCRTLLK